MLTLPLKNNVFSVFSHISVSLYYAHKYVDQLTIYTVALLMCFVYFLLKPPYIILKTELQFILQAQPVDMHTNI